MNEYVKGYGSSDGPITFIGEAPGAIEDQEGVPFVGPSGQFLDRNLREVSQEVLGYKVRLDDCYRTNVVKHRPPGNKLDRLSEIGHSVDEYIPQLWQEIGDIKSNCMVPLGNLALNAVCGKGTPNSGILKWRGSILPTLHLNRKAVPTIHPAALLRAQSGREQAGSKGGLDPRFKYVWRMDLARALEESKSPRYDPPSPQLEVIKDHVLFGRFIDKYKDHEILSVDIEVTRAIPICIGFAFNSWHGISVPLLDIMSWQNLDGVPSGELTRIWQMVAWLLENKKIIGQNFKFDHSALWNICKMRINHVHADVMIMAHNLYPEWEKKLAFHTSLWTRHPYYKDDGKEFNLAKGNIKQFMIYNARDAVVTFELYERFMEQATELIVPGFPNWKEESVFGDIPAIHDFYRRLESVGLKVNKQRQTDLIADYVEKLKAIKTQMDDISGGGINYNSHPQIRRLLFLRPGDNKSFTSSFGLPPRQSTDEDALVAVAANNTRKPEHRRFIELLLDYRRVRKALGTYFVAESDYDGRMRTNYRICGTETGRSSTGILKPPVRPKKIGLAFQTLTKHGEFGPEVRSEFEADDGYTIVETDMSQAEARIVARLGNDTKTLELFATKQDIHSITAGWIFGEDPKRIKEHFPELRFIGKTTRHAGNYDMGKKRLMEIVNTDAKKFNIDVSISEWKASKILDAFHAFSPAIRGDGGFHDSVRTALNQNNRVLINPFGRYRQFFGEWGHDLWKEAYAHIPQSTVPDHLRKAGFRVERRLRDMGIYKDMTRFESIFCIEAHDALYALIKTEFVPMYIKMMHEEIEVPIDFSRCTIQREPVIIPAESKTGTNLKECKVKGCKGCKYLHEYKFQVELAA